MSDRSLVVFVDVDDTLVRSFGSKQIPISRCLEQVQLLADEGAELYCWSSGGAEYAERVAMDLGIRECFRAFLPKPVAMIDDMRVSSWRELVELHPGRVGSLGVADVWQLLESRSS